MRRLKKIFSLIMIAGLLMGTSSCMTLYRIDNGMHKGWNKNTNNPHHPDHQKEKTNKHKGK